MVLMTAGSHPTQLRRCLHTRMPMVVDLIVSQVLTRSMPLETELMDMRGLRVILHMEDLITMTTLRITHPLSVQRLADLHRWTDVVLR
jgi:hypothetical protein